MNGIGDDVKALAEALIRGAGFDPSKIKPMSDAEWSRRLAEEEEERRRDAEQQQRLSLAAELRHRGVAARHVEILASDGAIHGTTALHAARRFFYGVCAAFLVDEQGNPVVDAERRAVRCGTVLVPGESCKRCGSPAVRRRNGGRILLLWGKLGRGKSFGLSWMVREAIREENAAKHREMRPVRITARIIRADMLVEHALLLRETYDRERGGWVEQRSRETGFTRSDVFSLPYLGIDDLGREGRMDRATAEHLVTVIGSRLEAGLDTWMTSNLIVEYKDVAAELEAMAKQRRDRKNAPHWREMFHRHDRVSGPSSFFSPTESEYVGSRLKEYGTVVYCDGPDLRERT